MGQSVSEHVRSRGGQYLLGLGGGLLPLMLEAVDLADRIPALIFTSVEAAGCLTYCAALLTAVACLVTRRGRPYALGLTSGLAATTAVAVMWGVLAALVGG